MKQVLIKVLYEFAEEGVPPEALLNLAEQSGCPFLQKVGGMRFQSDGTMPQGFCSRAWQSISGAVTAISSGSSFMAWNNLDGTSILCCPQEGCPAVFEISAQAVEYS